MTRWSKLQKQLYQLLDPGIHMQLHCRVVRMNSQYGSTDLPRYWITLEKETIWDYPGKFSVPGGGTSRTDSSFVMGYPHTTDVSAISQLIREYIDTPSSVLMSKQFDGDHWGLINILRAADRRIGVRQWSKIRRKIHNIAALKVLDARQQRPNAVLHNTGDTVPPEFIIIDSFEVTEYLAPQLDGLAVGKWYVLEGLFSSEEDLPAQGSWIEVKFPHGESLRTVVAGCKVRHCSGALQLIEPDVRIPRLSKVVAITTA
jgi:hypothetical protein